MTNLIGILWDLTYSFYYRCIKKKKIRQALETIRLKWAKINFDGFFCGYSAAVGFVIRDKWWPCQSSLSGSCSREAHRLAKSRNCVRWLRKLKDIMEDITSLANEFTSFSWPIIIWEESWLGDQFNDTNYRVFFYQMGPSLHHPMGMVYRVLEYSNIKYLYFSIYHIS